MGFREQAIISKRGEWTPYAFITSMGEDGYCIMRCIHNGKYDIVHISEANKLYEVMYN